MEIQPRQRIAAIDMLRGLAVIGMILVAYAGDWDHRFRVLTHADWQGFALADMIFPSFLFCVGAAMPYSLLKRAGDRPVAEVLAYLARRSAALFLLGLVLNLLPSFDFAHVRLMGILQRIGICYLAAGALALALGRRTADGFQLPLRSVLLAAAALAAAHGALLLAWDAPGCGRACFDSVHSLPAVIDRAVLGINHLWPYGLTNGQVTYEPEGLLSTVGALVNVLAGLAAGLVLHRGGDAWRRLALAAVVLLVAGFALGPWLPVVKKIWTPSFALLSSGFSLLALVLLRSATAGASVVLAFGANATLAFVAISLLDCVLQLPLNAGQSWHDSLAHGLGGLIADARIASVAYSAGVVVVLGTLLLTLYRKKLFLRL
ncbi:heparan-alpha-glucosaminide N-acetyltransferase domain-containing protein [Rugamonas sp. A1-17]|nr:heparan-alpha-glucosaminide N-acetyltransferase domain-containing protein [Rugamonas sp. A1-17]